MVYSCTGRKLYLPTLPFSNYSHVHLGAAGLPNVSFIPLLVKSGQLYWFWFLVGNSGWHLVQMESVLLVSLENDKRDWRLPAVIQGNTRCLLLFMLPFLFGICMPISFCKMLMLCLREQFGTDAPFTYLTSLSVCLAYMHLAHTVWFTIDAPHRGRGVLRWVMQLS